MKRAILLAALALGGCTITRVVDLYPDNEAAHSLGALKATIEGHGNLNGVMTMTLPSGEPMSGRYMISMGGAMGFGSASGSAYGPGGVASGSAFGSSVAVSGSGAGQADMQGPRGTTAHCEFMNNNFTGHGAGKCALSTGATYRMQY